MKIRVLCVGQKQPAWVEAGVTEYAKRLPKHLGLTLTELAPGSRSGGKVSADRVRAVEARRLLNRLQATDLVIALDEQGDGFTTLALASRLSDWQMTGRDVALLIGGADGLDRQCLARADAVWSLSQLTLPHGLARLLLIEQLYRAWSINEGHPYHRD